MNEVIFKGNINFWLDNTPNVYVNADIEFEIPKLNEALEHYNVTEKGLQELINNESYFLQEVLMEQFYINILELEYKGWENYMYEVY